jgi:tetratricopeptide (TPR) repeat protein/tRNA A-37 threonylcarbamoyl transferase component Bud32
MPEYPLIDPPRTSEQAATSDEPRAATERAGVAMISAEASNPTERYRLGEEIACGGMGVVYRATDAVLGREVAVKVLQEKYAPDSAAALRFADEARITGQLQHPNIPAVHDLGVLPDGRPFLAMKLIKGETLEDLLKGCTDPVDGRGRFVAAFEQLCQAVAYAHAHDVIHRDLKPANVMVGPFGEVQVMDWGLAKVLGARPDERADPDKTIAPTVVRSLRESDDLFTQADSVLGTPAFMSPEQAAGAVGAIDRRSDVFGLGAVLAVVLTDRPPFVSDTSDSTRVKAAQGDVGECFARLDTCGGEPDLVALCRRCLAPRPEDRPSDAGAVAKAVAALRAAADERARRAEVDRARAEAEVYEQRKRRRLLLMATGVVALVLSVGLSVTLWQMRQVERALAAEKQARQDETKAREQAFAALRSMTAEVVERRFAQGTALTDDDRAFLRGVIAQFDAFAAIKGEDADSRAVRAEGRFRVGNIRARLGEVQEAVQDFDEALSIRERLVADFPDRPEFRQALAWSHSNRGIMLRDVGRLREAELNCDEALDLRRQLAADFPSRPELRQELATSHNNRGILLSATGRFPEAEADHNQALSIYKQLVVEFPTRSEFSQELATSHNNRGVLLRSTGRHQEAQEDYDQALRLRKQLAANFPTRPEFRKDLAISHNNRGNLLLATGRSPEAEEDYGQAVSLFKQLAADFPGRPAFREGLAHGHNSRGVLLRDAGRLREAKEDFEQALGLRRQLAADFPNQPDLRNEFAGTCVNLAILHQRQGDWAAAKQLLLEGRPHHLVALKANPRHPNFRQFYRDHLNVLTTAHAALLEPEKAVRTAETCRNLGWDAPADAYDATCFLCQCIPIVAKHEKLDAEQRKVAALFYSDAAMKLLLEAVSKGYKDVPHMKTDTDLENLRQREDFQKLVAELEGK